MRVTHEDLPSSWASALINNDRSGLSLYPEGLAEFEAWAVENPTLLNPVGCACVEHVGYWQGKIRSMLRYDYLEK